MRTQQANSNANHTAGDGIPKREKEIEEWGRETVAVAVGEGGGSTAGCPFGFS